MAAARAGEAGASAAGVTGAVVDACEQMLHEDVAANKVGGGCAAACAPGLAACCSLSAHARALWRQRGGSEAAAQADVQTAEGLAGGGRPKGPLWKTAVDGQRAQLAC